MGVQYDKKYFETLITNIEKESQQLEYKSYEFIDGKFNGIDQKSKHKLFQEICAMANSSGGKIIIGIKEDNDHNPVKLQDTKVNRLEFEEWEQSFRLVLNSRIRPVIHGVLCTHIYLTDKNVIIIDVSKSIQRPHAYNNGNKDEFYIRYGNICTTMSYDVLKRSFSMLESIQQRTQGFRDNRIGMLVNDDLFPGIADKSSLLIHIIPEWSMDIGNFLDVSKARFSSKLKILSPPQSQGEAIYNTDGLSFVYGYDKQPIKSYLQLFHSGIVESAEFRLLNNKESIHRWDEFEVLISHKIYDYCLGLIELSIPHAFYIFVSLVNVRGKNAKIGEFEISPSLTRDIIKSRPTYWSEGMSYEKAISPIMNSLANAFGMSRSILYDEKLKPNVDKFSWLYESLK